MSLIKIQNAYLSFSNLKILHQANLNIYNNEKICLIGKNGAGKSTLLKIINKKQDLDKGDIFYKKNIKIDYLKQENPSNLNISIYDFISNKVNPKNIPKNFINNITSEKFLNNIECYSKYIIQVEKIIDKLGLNKEDLLSELSGGLIRKATLGRVLVKQPDLLLLDEPTNHLDMKTVKWLEKFLIKYTGSILFVSHDRLFTQNICTRIIDLDRGKIISWPGNYQNFIKLKNQNNNIEKEQQKLFQKKLQKEEQWIRKSTKARCTRNEGRVKNLKLLRNISKSYNEIEKIKNIQINQVKNYTGKIIFKANKIYFSIKNKVLINNFSSIIQHGDKIGLIGHNGCGKSTLIKIIIGQITPQKGNIHIGTGLKTVYFDQNRSILDPNKSIVENMHCGIEKVIINGKEKHLIGYLKDFLFPPYKIHSLVRTLSGGECNRLLLAKIFLKPSNVLILDEPTNDLDLDTLQILENVVNNYQGTVLIVSHDRIFLENSVNQYWIFQENGNIIKSLNQDYFQEQEKIFKNNIHYQNSPIKKKNCTSSIKSYKNNMFKINKTLMIIEKLEKKIKKLQKIINNPNFFTSNLDEKIPVLHELSHNEKELKKYLMQWEDLEKINYEKSQ